MMKMMEEGEERHSLAASLSRSPEWEGVHEEGREGEKGYK